MESRLFLIFSCIIRRSYFQSWDYLWSIFGIICGPVQIFWRVSMSLRHLLLMLCRWSCFRAGRTGDATPICKFHRRDCPSGVEDKCFCLACQGPSRLVMLWKPGGNLGKCFWNCPVFVLVVYAFRVDGKQWFVFQGFEVRQWLHQKNNVQVNFCLPNEKETFLSSQTGIFPPRFHHPWPP